MCNDTQVGARETMASLRAFMMVWKNSSKPEAHRALKASRDAQGTAVVRPNDASLRPLNRRAVRLGSDAPVPTDDKRRNTLQPHVAVRPKCARRCAATNDACQCEARGLRLRVNPTTMNNAAGTMPSAAQIVAARTNGKRKKKTLQSFLVKPNDTHWHDKGAARTHCHTFQHQRKALVHSFTSHCR